MIRLNIILPSTPGYTTTGRFLIFGSDMVGKYKMNTGTHFKNVSNGYLSKMLLYNQSIACMYVLWPSTELTYSHTHCPEESKMQKNGFDLRNKLPMCGALATDTRNSALIISHIHVPSNGFNEHYLTSI
jgi:hypothetical protein